MKKCSLERMKSRHSDYFSSAIALHILPLSYHCINLLNFVHSTLVCANSLSTFFVCKLLWKIRIHGIFQRYVRTYYTQILMASEGLHTHIHSHTMIMRLNGHVACYYTPICSTYVHVFGDALAIVSMHVQTYICM